jgi:hypothetical protein
MTRDVLRYDRLIEEALRSVVRKVLIETAEHGLPGNHHFYITFKTGHDGVVMPARMRAAYPEEMTIVLQHQFWNLTVEEDLFRITVSFKKREADLEIPFTSITTFADPSVQFGLSLQSHHEVGMATVGEEDGDLAPAADAAEEDRDMAAGEVITLDSFRRK